MSLTPTLLIAVLEIAAVPSSASVADVPPSIPAVQTIVRKQPVLAQDKPVRDFPAVEALATTPAGASTAAPKPPVEGRTPPIPDAPTVSATPSGLGASSTVFPGALTQPSPPLSVSAPLSSPSPSHTSHTSTVGIPPLGANDLLLTDCIVLFDKRKNATIGANLQGRLMELRIRETDAAGKETEIPVREGLVVKAEQVLGYQDDRTQQAGLRVAKSKLAVAEAEAKKDLEVQYAFDSFEVDKARVEKYRYVNSQATGAIAEMDVREAELKVKQSTSSFHLAKYNLEVVKRSELEVAKEEVAAAEVAIERHRLIAPFDGVVIEVIRAEGEWLREGDPIVRIVQVDTLIIKKKIGQPDCTPDMFEGRPVTVYVTFAGKPVQLPGRVYFANPEAEADGFEVLIEVENRQVNGTWQLRKGTMVNAVVHLEAPRK